MILERIKEYIDFKKLTVSAFEKSIGMSNASFGKSLKNGGAIGTDKLENILYIYTDINPVWLLTGKGSMLCNNKMPEEVKCSTPVTASVSNADESIIYKMYKEKDLEVKDLMETIGSLKEQIRQLKREKGSSASDVSDSVHANVG